METKEINNLGLIAGLMSLGYPPLERKKTGKIVYFIFESDPELEKLCEEYYNNRMSVDAQTYHTTLKTVKSIIYRM